MIWWLIGGLGVLSLIATVMLYAALRDGSKWDEDETCPKLTYQEPKITQNGLHTSTVGAERVIERSHVSSD